jgi:signal transduction histidine kinase
MRPLTKPFPIQRALFVGFGLVFAFWLVSGFDLVRRLAVVQERTSATIDRSSRAEQLLSTVRVRLLLGSVYVRDALFDASDEASGYYRDQLNQARDDIDRALDAYVPVVDSPAERDQFRQLRAEVADFWETVLPVFEWDSTRRLIEARNLLRRRVIPKRDVIIRISGRIQDLNRAALRQQQEETAAIYRVMRLRMWETSGLALFAGLVVAVTVMRHAGRLEARIREQARKELQNTHDLQRLSAKLVRAQEDERRTIARELHDEIGQALTAIKVELSVAARSSRSATDRAEDALREARSITDRALQQVRDLSQLLHPAMLDDLGLPSALEWHLRRFSTRTGIRAELLQEGMEDRLATEIETCVYRIVQEALTNVARHSHASSCRLYLQRLAHTVLLTIEDDGQGFSADHEPVAGRGLGLLGIQERVSGFRGTFRLEAEAGKGTRLTVELPALPRAPADDQPAGSPGAGAERVAS